jgi:hypothetical protein
MLSKELVLVVQEKVLLQSKIAAMAVRTREEQSLWRLKEITLPRRFSYTAHVPGRRRWQWSLPANVCRLAFENANDQIIGSGRSD